MADSSAGTKYLTKTSGLVDNLLHRIFFNNFLPTSVGGDVVRIVKTSWSKEEISGVGGFDNR